MTNLVDIHCHLLPYVDDGAENFTEARHLLESQLQQGVQTICFTPHWRTGMFESTQQTVEAQFARLQQEAAKRYPQLRLCLGREYFCDSEFLDHLFAQQSAAGRSSTPQNGAVPSDAPQSDAALSVADLRGVEQDGARQSGTSPSGVEQSGAGQDDAEQSAAEQNFARPVCALGEGRTLLVEFSGRYPFELIEKRVRQVQQCGYQVLIAHVERYPAVHQQADGVQRLRRLGARIQVNAGAILGREGGPTKRLCKKMLKAGLVDVVASDAHGTAFRPPELGACAAYLEKKLGKAEAKRLLHDDPLLILQSAT